MSSPARSASRRSSGTTSTASSMWSALSFAPARTPRRSSAASSACGSSFHRSTASPSPTMDGGRGRSRVLLTTTRPRGGRQMAVATRWSRERADRQQRRELHASDFAEIAETGFLELVVPTEAGGLWAATATSTRAVCEVLRELARADSSVALVSSMHLTVVYLCWLSDLEAPPERARAWDSQRHEVFRSIQDGAWYGTITS